MLIFETESVEGVESYATTNRAPVSANQRARVVRSWCEVRPRDGQWVVSISRARQDRALRVYIPDLMPQRHALAVVPRHVIEFDCETNARLARASCRAVAAGAERQEASSTCSMADAANILGSPTDGRRLTL